MIILQGEPESWVPPEEGSAVAIGVFDGVHRGHQLVIGALDDAPAASKVVLTFGTHPAEILSDAGVAPPMLTSLKGRLALLGDSGIDRVAVLDFDPETVAMTPLEFVERVLIGGLNARFVAIGEGFRFGHGAAGTTETLEELGLTHGFTVSVVPILREGGSEIRSTTIRQAVAAGDVERAALLLGRPHVIRGVVVPGEGRGATIGVPTANVSFPDRLAVPKRGVYAVYAEVDDRRFPGVANLGVRPTFGGEEEVLEVHLINERLDLRGRELGVHFVARLRDEQRFDGVEALVAQIQRDIKAANSLLSEVPQTS
jgi:riboflavin kinase/FMN adenylyltransferase